MSAVTHKTQLMSHAALHRLQLLLSADSSQDSADVPCSTAQVSAVDVCCFTQDSADVRCSTAKVSAVAVCCFFTRFSWWHMPHCTGFSCCYLLFYTRFSSCPMQHCIGFNCCCLLFFTKKPYAVTVRNEMAAWAKVLLGQGSLLFL